MICLFGSRFYSVNYSVVEFWSCVCFVALFPGYHETFIPAESGRDLYKGLDRSMLIYRLILHNYVWVIVNPFCVILFCKVEATEVFFAVTKLFQSRDMGLRRMVYLIIKEISPSADEVTCYYEIFLAC